jgi:hypothetical protein
MNVYASVCDDFYVNMTLNTEMDLPSTRETVLHYFERIQKHYPSMRNFFSRDKGDFVLEEDKEKGHYRWATVEARRICSGYVNPPSVEEALKQHHLVLELAPYMLTVSPLDCEWIDLLFGFDYTYRGNHNELVTEALGVHPAFERLVEFPGATVISNEPLLRLALDEECRLQCQVSIETRTNAYHVRSGEYPEDQLSVYVTARRYGSLDPGTTFEATLNRLLGVCRELIDDYVLDHLLNPLRKTIALK